MKFNLSKYQLFHHLWLIVAYINALSSWAQSKSSIAAAMQPCCCSASYKQPLFIQFILSERNWTFEETFHASFVLHTCTTGLGTHLLIKFNRSINQLNYFPHLLPLNYRCPNYLLCPSIWPSRSFIITSRAAGPLVLRNTCTTKYYKSHNAPVLWQTNQDKVLICGYYDFIGL